MAASSCSVVCAPTAGQVTLNSCGPVGQIFRSDCAKAIYVVEQLTYPVGVTSGPLSLQDAGTVLRFSELNVYKLQLNVYPEGCPAASLDIEMEVVSTPNDFLNVSVVTEPNSLTMEGEIPAGTQLRFFTSSQKLRYFNRAQLVGQVTITPVAAQLEAAIARTISNSVAYISQRPGPLISLLPPLPMPAPGVVASLPAQYPNASSVWPWTQATLPWKKDQPFPSGPGLIITPPAPVPALPVLVDGYDNKYDKFRSVPDTIIFYLGKDALAVSPAQESWTIFLRNFADRGYASTSAGQADWQKANFAKRQYMNALSLDKMQFYLPKIEAFANSAFTRVVANRLPLVSSFQQEVVLFFLRIHIGEQEFPSFVTKYFSRFIEFVGLGNSNTARGRELLIYGNQTAASVFEYFKSKSTAVIAAEDKSSIAYWWNLSGLSAEALLFEAVHNMVAFSQFTNVIYSTIYASLRPTNPLNAALPPYPNFFVKYAEATSGVARLNVVRELYRLLVPNSGSFSRVNSEDPLSLTSTHFHQSIMVQNSPGTSQAQQLGSYFTYDTSRYGDFSASFDNIIGMPVDNDYLTTLPTSPLDQETVVQASSPLIPIFPKPTYTPFGLGYRRCAGEILVYLVTERLLEQFGRVQFEIREPGSSYPTIFIAPFKGVPDNIFAVQPF